MPFKFSVGPWNVSSGADVYGPATRSEIPMEEKIRKFKELGFDAVQFHDDDAVPNINELTEEEIKAEARKVRALLDEVGLKAEFVAPRLWMDPHCVDGGFTSNSEEDRKFALWRAFRSIDIARELGADLIVLWLAREGTLCSESKSAVVGTKRIVEAIDAMLDYDQSIRIAIEPKPNEPIDRSFCGTLGHVMGVSAATKDPSRVGGLLESAHAVLAGLDPANEMGRGEYVGLDVKAMRTTRDDAAYEHLKNSLAVVKALEAKADRYDYAFEKKCIRERNYEALEMYVLNLLMGI